MNHAVNLLLSLLLSTEVAERLTSLLNSSGIPMNAANVQRVRDLTKAVLSAHEDDISAIYDSLQSLSTEFSLTNIESLPERGFALVSDFGSMIATEVVLQMKGTVN